MATCLRGVDRRRPPAHFNAEGSLQTPPHWAARQGRSIPAMQAPRLPENETERLALLHALDVLDHTPDPALDRITRTAARLFRVPIALITLVDSNRQWFMSRVGMKVRETPRNDSMCGHAILEPGTMVVCDAQQDP